MFDQNGSRTFCISEKIYNDINWRNQKWKYWYE